MLQTDNTQAHHDHGSRSEPELDSRRRYRHAFLARYLKPLVFDAMLARGWRQYEVAEWLDISERALSEYLTGRSHPSDEQLRKFAPLRCDAGRVRRVILADKLAYWIDHMDAEIDDVRGALRRIEAERARRASDN